MARQSHLHCITCAAAPEARFESAVAVARGQMFVIGGHREPELAATNNNYAYDPIADTWKQYTPCPKAISHLTAAVSDDRYIWLVGGYEGQHPGAGVRSTLRFDVVEDRWEDGPPLPHVRASGGLALVGRELHYYGGLDADRSTNRPDHWMLDIDNPDRWRPAAPVPFARTHAATAVLNGDIYAIGGHFGHDIPGQPGMIAPEKDLNYVHRYLKHEDRWEEVRPLSRRRSHCEPGTFVLNGRIICIGGRSINPGARLPRDLHDLRWFAWRFKNKVKASLGLWKPNPGVDDVIAYDPGSDAWLTVGQIPEGLYAPAAAEINGKVILTNGGRNGWQDPSDKTYRLEF